LSFLLKAMHACTEEQTREITQMKFPPLVIAFDNDEYYLLFPDWVKKEAVSDLNLERQLFHLSTASSQIR